MNLLPNLSTKVSPRQSPPELTSSISPVVYVTLLFCCLASETGNYKEIGGCYLPRDLLEHNSELLTWKPYVIWGPHSMGHMSAMIYQHERDYLDFEAWTNEEKSVGNVGTYLWFLFLVPGWKNLTWDQPWDVWFCVNPTSPKPQNFWENRNQVT